jgi:hypothetical protein
LADGTIRIQGNVFVTGDVNASGEIRDHHGTLSALRDHYNAHGHPDPQGGTTATTNQPD